MTMRKRLCLFVFLMLLPLGMISCEQKTDLSVIKNSNCTPPCWNGITPGSTTGERALTQLTGMKEVKQGTVKRGTASNYLFEDQIYWDFENGSFGNISVENGVVVEIKIGKLNVDLEDVVSIFGNPEQIMFLPYNGNKWKINILFPQKGIWLFYTKAHTRDGRTVDIKPNDSVEEITFFSTNVYNELLLNSADPFLYQESLQLLNILQPWNGYKEELIIMGE